MSNHLTGGPPATLVPTYPAKVMAKVTSLGFLLRQISTSDRTHARFGFLLHIPLRAVLSGRESRRSTQVCHSGGRSWSATVLGSGLGGLRAQRQRSQGNIGWRMWYGGGLVVQVGARWRRGRPRSLRGRSALTAKIPSLLRLCSTPSVRRPWLLRAARLRPEYGHGHPHASCIAPGPRTGAASSTLARCSLGSRRLLEGIFNSALVAALLAG